jgi:NAD(P) transhydrogenase subunit beta
MTIVVDLCYLVSTSLFNSGLRLLSSPRTARRGNLLSMLGMFIAVVITLLDKQIIDYKYIIAGIIIGGLIGACSALKVKMTAMPQMVALVIPVGGADMRVVVALLNSYSGLAAATTGFVINNYVLIVSGALVGASGIILTNLMCKAMNRSLGNVLFGGVGGEVLTGGLRKKQQVTRYSPLDAAVTLENGRSIIIVPGYGLAVAQAQYILQDTVEFLRKKGA